MMKNYLTTVIVLTGLLSCQQASAHVVLTDQLAMAGSYYKATLRVGHGCGDEPTTSITVKIPAGFEGAKPQPKYGWTLTIKKELLPKPYTSHGITITDDVVEIKWEANSKDFYLPNEQFDEFSFFMRLPATPGPHWISVRQECVKGINDWAEVPASGTSTKGLKTPAALLELLPSQQHDHH
jgi:periplasmic copper chaperone A